MYGREWGKEDLRNSDGPCERMTQISRITHLDHFKDWLFTCQRLCSPRTFVQLIKRKLQVAEVLNLPALFILNNTFSDPWFIAPTINTECGKTLLHFITVTYFIKSVRFCSSSYILVTSKRSTACNLKQERGVVFIQQRTRVARLGKYIDSLLRDWLNAMYFFTTEEKITHERCFR